MGDMTLSDYVLNKKFFTKRWITKALKDNPDGARLADVVSYRYGKLDKVPHTLQETANRIGVSRERVRQLEKKALLILRKKYIQEGV